MSEFLRLTRNELHRIIARKKLLVVLAILAGLTALFVYGEVDSYRSTVERLEQRLGPASDFEWEQLLEQQIREYTDRLSSPYLPDQARESMELRVQQMRYFLEEGINPITPGTARFLRRFFEQATPLLLPLLILVLSADLISGEFSSGTIRLLLGRAVSRRKIFWAKWVAFCAASGVILLATAVMAVIASSIAFDYSGWNEPAATGFQVINQTLQTSGVVSVVQWKYNLMVFSLAWIVVTAVGAVSQIVSVLFRQGALAFGVMAAVIAAGNIAVFFLGEWKIMPYLFISNLAPARHLSGITNPGTPQSLTGSLLVLAAWSIGSLITAQILFTRRDVLA